MMKSDNQKITLIPVTQLKPNAYNPNVMTKSEFGELIEEIKYLGRIAKPIIVRRNHDCYEIVDGEHSWRAAKEVGLTELPCEIIAADDFEARRQTFKRNQHGTHDPVKQGQMFKTMLELKKISQRELAKEIYVSEGTLRNSLIYAEIYEEHKDEEFRDEICHLTVQQVRWYGMLPKVIAKAWLYGGADMKELESCIPQHWIGDSGHWERSDIKAFFQSVEETGLLEHLSWEHTHKGLKRALKKIIEWEKWESQWARAGIDRKELRRYTRYYFEKAFVVREADLMDSILSMIIRIEGNQASFLISADEFDQAMQESNDLTIAKDGKLVGDSGSAFVQRLKAYIFEKTGITVKNDAYYRDKLLEAELLDAPDYIRQCRKNPEFKHSLWKIKCDQYTDEKLFEQAKREIAKTGFIYHDDWAVKDAIEWQIKRNIKQYEYERDMQTKTVEEYAEMIVNSIGMYTDDQSEHRKLFVENLSRLTKTELYAIIENIKYTDEMIAYTVAIKALKESIK